jgi:RNA-binding protein
MTPDPQHVPLTGSQRRYLRSRAHHLQPAVQIGKTGLTPTVLAAIDRALQQHELIKVRFQDFKAHKRELSRTIAQASNSELVGTVGHVCMFYRRHPDPDKRTVHLPAS